MSMFVKFQVPADSGFHSGERGDRHLGIYFFNSGCRECRLASFYLQCCSVSVCSLLGGPTSPSKASIPTHIDLLTAVQTKISSPDEVSSATQRSRVQQRTKTLQS